MLATSIVDPLLSSPQRAKRHDDDMAALQKSLQLNDNMMSPLELPPSAVAISATSSEASLSSLFQQEQAREAELFKKEEAAMGKDDQADDVDNDEDAETELDQLMNRGNYLRQLRLLALADEQERQAQELEESSSEEKKDNDTTSEIMESIVHTLPTTNDKVLDYNSYLAHQRYHDDLKHIDMKYMDFGSVNNASHESGKLVVEQRKRLGKGGLVWDAAFVLGEHVIAHENEWNSSDTTTSASAAPPRIVELGAGTGLTGMMVAKATKSVVTITDLPELVDLMSDNIQLNFGANTTMTVDESQLTLTNEEKKAKGTISGRVLRWGIEEDYEGGPYDVILGADIVTSLYDPVALAHTIHALSGPDTKIYISGKSRLDKPHEEFDAEMNRLFETVRKIETPSSRLRSPNVFIIVAEGKL